MWKCLACFQFSGMQTFFRDWPKFVTHSVKSFMWDFHLRLQIQNAFYVKTPLLTLLCEKLANLWFVHCCEQLWVAVVISWHSMITWWQSAMCRFLTRSSRTVTIFQAVFTTLQKRRRNKGLSELLTDFLLCPFWCNISLSCHIIEVPLGSAFYEAVYLNENINLIIKTGTAASSC